MHQTPPDGEMDSRRMTLRYSKMERKRKKKKNLRMNTSAIRHSEADELRNSLLLRKKKIRFPD
jgi:hypothetical protein